MRWRLPVRRGTQVVLAYVNSLYSAPTEEWFTVTDRGFELREVRSTSEAVLDHNQLPTPYRRDGPFFVAAIRRTIPRLVTRIGATGRQRLRVGDTDLPLYSAGTGSALTIQVRRGPIVMHWLDRFRTLPPTP